MRSRLHGSDSRPNAGGIRIGINRLGLVLALGVAPLAPHMAGAQARMWASAGAEVVLAYERAAHLPGNRSLGELRVVQPVVAFHAGAWRRLLLTGMLNFEGVTIPDGELVPGNWGEGFVDRRHPHTYVHELVLSANDLLSEDNIAHISVSAGKGFAPFGTDDPMVRPFLRFPVNHHLSQILERAIVVAAARTRFVSGEFGLFNGDEPERPGQWPRISGRFGDSWAARLGAYPIPGVEVEASHAHVHSPEHRPGAGTNQSKWSLSARWSRTLGRSPVYALLEWARTSEAGGFFVFTSVLAEGAWTSGRHRLQYRFERTERPEEERISDFRSLRPHLENSILGITRWTVQTVGYEVQAIRTGAIRVRPLVEISYGHMATVGGGVFDIEGVYGADHFWSLSLGVRLGAGITMHRMGRYGALEDMEMAHHRGEEME